MNNKKNVRRDLSIYTKEEKESSEREIQFKCESLINNLGLTLIRVPDSVLASIKNSQYRKDKREALKYLTGQPDLVILRFKEGRVRCLLIELKSVYGKLSTGQKHFFNKLGMEPIICYSFKEAEKLILEFAK